MNAYAIARQFAEQGLHVVAVPWVDEEGRAMVYVHALEPTDSMFEPIRTNRAVFAAAHCWGVHATLRDLEDEER